MTISRLLSLKKSLKLSVFLATIIGVKILFAGNSGIKPYRDAKMERARVMDRQVSQVIDREKVILLWHPRNWKEKTIDSTACGRCRFTTDRKSINDPATAAVIFRSEQIDTNDMPVASSRRKDQLYIWSAGESAPAMFHLRKMWLFWENKYGFNMTMSYRKDSSLYHPYGTIKEALEHIQRKGYRSEIEKLMSLKTKLAVAVVSNCNSTPGAKVRLQLLNSLLRAGLKMDAFGRCFSNQEIPKGKTQILEAKLSEYKFFLAFENSYHCKDYITEKFFRNALYIGLVPVVWGTPKEDYSEIAPEKSFIHVEDYPSITHLINHMNYLDKNETAYLEYFEWWYRSENTLNTTYSRDDTYCILCKLLHGQSMPNFQNTDKQGGYFTRNTTQRSIRNLYSWFYYGNSRDCLRTQLRISSNNTKVF